VFLAKGVKHNLLSISQLYDKALKVTFEVNNCLIPDKNSHQVVLISNIFHNICMIDLDYVSSCHISYLIFKKEDPSLWHRKVDHIHISHLSKSIHKEMVIGLPTTIFQKDKVCYAYKKENKLKLL